MNNYYLAINGVKFASRILQIKEPLVSFFTDEIADEKDIQSLFDPKQYVIALNENWLDNLENSLEVKKMSTE